jgi:hypothetical protein
LRRLKAKIEGVLAHCRWPLHTSLLEGINNKIKVIKRMAYGYRDDEYFFLRIRAAFPGNVCRTNFMTEYNEHSDSHMTDAPLTVHRLCPGCGYDLFATVGPPYRCPECGQQSSYDQLHPKPTDSNCGSSAGFVVSLLVGVVAWAALRFTSKGTEFWDSSSYFSVGIPAMCIASAILGGVWPLAPYRWSLAIVAVQALALMVHGMMNGGGPLAVVGACFLIGIASLCTAFAYVGSMIRRLFSPS